MSLYASGEAPYGGQTSGDLTTADVIIATVQTAAKRDLATETGASVLTADEVHRYGSGGWSEALRASFVHALGLTATLTWRLTQCRSILARGRRVQRLASPTAGRAR